MFSPSNDIQNLQDTSDNLVISAGLSLANAFLRRERLRYSGKERLATPVSPSKKKVTFADKSDDTSCSTSSPQAETKISVPNNNNNSKDIPHSLRTPTIREKTTFEYVAEFESSRRCNSSNSVGGSILHKNKVSRPPTNPDGKINMTPLPYLQRRNTDGCDLNNDPSPPISPLYQTNGSGSKQTANVTLRPYHLRRNSISGTTVETTGNIPDFDKTYGRCVKHPATLIAIKAPFRKSGWRLIRNNCPLCDSELKTKESNNEDDARRGSPVYHPDTQPQQLSLSNARVRGTVSEDFPDSKSKQFSRSCSRRQRCVKNQNQEGKPKRKQPHRPRDSGIVGQGRTPIPMSDHIGPEPYHRSSMPSLCNKYPHNDRTYHGGNNAQYHLKPPQCASNFATLDAGRKNASWPCRGQHPIDPMHNNMVWHNARGQQRPPSCNNPAPSGHLRRGPSESNVTTVAAMSWKSLIGAGKYSGEVDKNGVPAGKGRIVFDSGSVYEGRWMDGNPKEIAESLAIIEKFSS
ncbi:hypothetical protein ACHAXS_004126 [Conticribra weissflogii]